ncbi:jerky protein homolog-like [Bombus pascuorum]|uniref:jerky protein homolog-like n=1 Tax=Bombus pascuorum TaxID=65598 RepID=UPI00298D81DB|nr:jerky protein homolog-like [Bombus pascuorum]
MTDRGVVRESVGNPYRVSVPTVGNADTQQALFYAHIANGRCLGRCALCDTINLERIVCNWFLHCVGYNVEISGEDIQRKAVEFNQKLNVNPYFQPSNGWLQRFRIHHYIFDADICRDFPVSIAAAVYTFKDFFNRRLNHEGCTLENIYSVVYRPIAWKSLPENTLIVHRAKLTEDEEMLEDHVTALFCTNATGCHKLPILIVGSVEENRGLQNFNMNAFPIIYRSNSKAWMDSTIFNQWFENHFIKSVQERQERNGSRMKTLLLIGNVRWDLNELDSKEELVRVRNFPYNVRPLLDPMDHGIIACFKRKYRKELVKTLMSFSMCNTKEEVIDHHKELNIWDCCHIVHKAWSKVDSAIIKRAWDKLLTFDVIRNVDAKKRKSDIFKTVKLLHSLPGCEQCNENDVSNWFESENIRDKIMAICTDVAPNFRYNTMNRVNIGIVDDGPGPSYS